MKLSIAALFGLVSSQPGPNHPHCSINVLIQGRCHDVYNTMDAELKRMGPGHPSPAGDTYYVFREEQDKNILGYKTHESRTGDKWIDDFRFEFVDLGHGNDHECTVHGVSMTQNETHYDHDANFCNLYNVFRESGIKFEEPTADECQFMPKDPRVCSGPSELHPHCDLNALFEHDCHSAYSVFDEHLQGMHPGGKYPSPDGKDFHVKREM